MAGIGRASAALGLAVFCLSTSADASSHGQTGSHYGVTISTGATRNMSFANGVYAATGNRANLNVNDLSNALATGNVEVTTGNGSNGIDKGDLHVESPLTWAAASALTLDAYHSIFIDRPISDAGTGAVTLTTNDGGTSGLLPFGAKGSLSFLGTGNSLTINGTVYKLENSVKALSSAIRRNPKGAYALSADYNASQDGTYSKTPIGATLTGTVEGLGNTISHLAIDVRVPRGESTGLFRWVGSGGAVASLRLEKLYLKFRGYGIGGGLVGQNDGTLYNDEVSGSAHSGRDTAGGLVGATTGMVISCSARVQIDAYGGGLAGENFGTITLSHADGSSSGQGVGGLVADNEGDINQSYATGSGYDAGFVEYNECNCQNIGTIENSYATGAAYSAGFAGLDDELQATISTSYSTGSVNATGGGFDCNSVDERSFANDYWDTTTSGTQYGFCNQENFTGVTGLTTAQLQSGLPKGLNPKIWAENPNINNGFPYLINNPPPQ